MSLKKKQRKTDCILYYFFKNQDISKKQLMMGRRLRFLHALSLRSMGIKNRLTSSWNLMCFPRLSKYYDPFENADIEKIWKTLYSALSNFTYFDENLKIALQIVLYNEPFAMNVKNSVICALQNFLDESRSMLNRIKKHMKK
ncbi:MAG: hypothetical protein ACTSXG_04250 [Alphaproteobacteria bacterium]